MPLKFIKRLLGQDNDTAVRPPPAAVAQPRRQAQHKQVFAGRLVAEPEFVNNLESARLIKACEEHVVCPCTPHIEQQRIYRVSGVPDAAGNMPIEYEGIAVSCMAITEFGLAIAQEEGHNRPYRYADRKHILSCCCGDPQRCAFFQRVERQRLALERNLKT